MTVDREVQVVVAAALAHVAYCRSGGQQNPDATERTCWQDLSACDLSQQARCESLERQIWQEVKGAMKGVMEIFDMSKVADAAHAREAR